MRAALTWVVGCATLPCPPQSKVKQKKVKAATQKQKVFRGPNPVISVTMWGVKHMVRVHFILAPLP